MNIKKTSLLCLCAFAFFSACAVGGDKSSKGNNIEEVERVLKLAARDGGFLRLHKYLSPSLVSKGDSDYDPVYKISTEGFDSTFKSFLDADAGLTIVTENGLSRAKTQREEILEGSVKI